MPATKPASRATQTLPIPSHIADGGQFQELEDALLNGSNLTCQGILKREWMDQLTIYYSDGSAAQYVRVGRWSTQDFALAPDLVLRSGILTMIGKHLHDTVAAVPLRLQAVSEGHAGIDEPTRPSESVGTLLLTLPSMFTGGDIETEDGSVYPTKAGSWMFFRGAPDVYSELEVSSGTKISILYDVVSVSSDGDGMGAISCTLRDLLRTTLCDESLMIEGGTLALGLQETYTAVHKAERWRTELRGTDAEWADTLEAAGIPFEMAAVYPWCERTSCGCKLFAADRKRKYEPYKGRKYYLRFNTNAFEDACLWPGSEEASWCEMAEDDWDFFDKNMLSEVNVVWLAEPKGWGGRDAYPTLLETTESDEETDEELQVGAAICVRIPPAGRRDGFFQAAKKRKLE